MGNCGTCKYWTKTNDYGGTISADGLCSEIENKLTININYGYEGGYIEGYETDECFGCILWKLKEE